jgi:hypothetical protein
MRRYLFLTVLVVLALGVSAGTALAETNGGGKSGDAPGQANAGANCTNVWQNLQANLIAGGGPKSQPVGDPPFTTGPTNCDHFWQEEGVIGPNA